MNVSSDRANLFDERASRHICIIYPRSILLANNRSQFEIWEGNAGIIPRRTSGQHPVEVQSPPMPAELPSQVSVARSVCRCSHISLAASSRDACSSSCIPDFWKVNMAPFIHGLDRCIAFSSSICLTACYKSRPNKGH